jgi:hypothetical protein
MRRLFVTLLTVALLAALQLAPSARGAFDLKQPCAASGSSRAAAILMGFQAELKSGSTEPPPPPEDEYRPLPMTRPRDVGVEEDPKEEPA